MSEKFPLVSIVIPVYNGSNYMREAIDSALAQTYPNCEIIVVNDGSKDDGATETIALSYGDRIRYFSKPNGGVSTALNMGIEKMQGEYFSWLSHDDFYAPEKIRHQMEYISQNKLPKNIILYGSQKITDSRGKILYHLAIPKPHKPLTFEPVLYAYLNGCTLLIPKVCFEATGHFDPALKTSQDYDMWNRFSKKYYFAGLDKADVYSRRHAEQGTVTLECFGKESEEHTLKLLRELDQEDKGNETVYIRSEFLYRNIQSEPLRRFLSEKLKNIKFLKIKRLCVQLSGTSWYAYIIPEKLSETPRFLRTPLRLIWRVGVLLYKGK